MLTGTIGFDLLGVEGNGPEGNGPEDNELEGKESEGNGLGEGERDGDAVSTFFKALQTKHYNLAAHLSRPVEPGSNEPNFFNFFNGI
ncbi:MAG: hypothetical protein ACFB16_27115 [Phormidesmis sp.]